MAEVPSIHASFQQKLERAYAEAIVPSQVPRINKAIMAMVDNVIALPPNFPALFIIGKRGSGKSVLLEKLLETYYKLGYIVLDWNGAFDLEGLQWCVPDFDRVPTKEEPNPYYAFPILLITPALTEIKTNGRTLKMWDEEKKVYYEVDAVSVVPDTMPLKDILRKAHTEKRICVFSIYFYQVPQRGQKKFSEMLRDLPVVMRDGMEGNINCVMGLRKLADLGSSKMKTFKGGDQTESKRTLANSCFNRMPEWIANCIGDPSKQLDIPLRVVR